MGLDAIFTWFANLDEDKVRHRLCWLVCLAMFLRCNWEGDHKTAGIYCVLMLMTSTLQVILYRVTNSPPWL